MILGLLAMIAANAATLFGARVILNRIRTGRPASDAVLFLVVRLLLISAAVVLAGLSHALTPLGLGLAGIGFLAALRPSCNLPKIFPLPWNRWLTLAALLIALRLLLQVWFFAPAFEDVLSYHLPKVAEWVRAGAFIRELGSDPRATFPAGFELLEIWWTVFLHHDVLIEMAGVELLLLACVSAYALAREFGWSSSCAMGAAVAVALIPGIHHQATSCLNDGAVVGWIAATAALVVARVHPSLVLVAVGLGIGTKPTFAFALPGLILLAVLFRRETVAHLADRRTGAALAAGALLAGSFWYVRNLVFFGNPIHPMGSAGMESVSGLPLQRFGPGLGTLVDNLRSLIDVRIYDHVAPPSASHAFISNWGALAFAVGFPALIYLVRSEERLRRLALSILVSLLCVWSLVSFDPFSARFVLFAPVVAALAAARLVERHRFALPIAALALALQFWMTNLPAEIDRQTATRMARQSWRERTSTPFPIVEFTERPIGYLSDYSGTPYWLYGPGFSRPVVYLRERSIDALVAALHAHQIRVVYVGVMGRSNEDLPATLRGEGFVVR